MKSFSFFRFDWQRLWQLVYPYFFQSSEKLTAWQSLTQAWRWGRHFAETATIRLQPAKHHEYRCTNSRDHLP
jgi:hypothetical protein